MLKPDEEVTMKYMTLIYGDAAAWNALSEEEQKRVAERYMALSREPVVADGAELQDAETATTVRIRNGETLTTDGPFAETKEQLGGYYLIDCGSLDEAIEFAARIPAAERGGVEVRPLVER
ncbi:MAG TPA: YciI family protein [Gaiellaceae bacterium]|jgi:hypothetical protein|nr:YciI family protein [Gaiellaceae bacterium]